MKRICVIFLLLMSRLYPQDGNICVPATLQHLAETRHQQYFSLNQWIQNCHTDLVTGTELNNLASAWYRFEPNTKLVSIYQLINIKDIPCDENIPIQDNHFYIWVGMRGGGRHCALIYHSGNHFVLVHSQKYNDEHYFTETITDQEFFKSTLAIIDQQ